ncbi:hypothetical protein ACWNXI_11490 [Caldibacillus thermoamylovorans]
MSQKDRDALFSWRLYVLAVSVARYVVPIEKHPNSKMGQGSASSLACRLMKADGGALEGFQP